MLPHPFMHDVLSYDGMSYLLSTESLYDSGEWVPDLGLQHGNGSCLNLKFSILLLEMIMYHHTRSHITLYDHASRYMLMDAGS